MARFARYRTERPGYVGATAASSAGGLRNITTGLIEAWDMDETGPGTRSGALGNYDLTDNGNSIGSRTGNGGGTAADIDGLTANEWFFHAADAGLRPSSFTFSVWVYLDALDTNGHGVASLYGAAAADDMWVSAVYNNGGPMPYVLVADGLGGTQTAQSGTTFSVGEWVHLCGWYDETTKKASFSKNAESPVTSPPLTAGLNTSGTEQMQVGHNENVSASFGMWDGGMQAFQYWSRVLTPAERNWLASGVRLYADLAAVAA